MVLPLQDRSIKAVIDTAAMVTVISDQIYKEMKPNPPCLKATTLQTAGRNIKMIGRIIGPVSIKLGNVIFPTLVHVAPINNDMLLGLDFLLRIGAGINLKERHLVVTGATDIVPLEIEYENIRTGRNVVRVHLFELLGSSERKWGVAGVWKIYPVELQDRARLHFYFYLLSCGICAPEDTEAAGSSTVDSKYLYLQHHCLFLVPLAVGSYVEFLV